MKKSVIILTIMLYLLPTAGFSINLHYCDGEFAGAFVEGIPPSCGCESEDDDCCQNEFHYFKDNTSHQKTEQSSVKKNSFSYAISPTEEKYNFFLYKYFGSGQKNNVFEPPGLRRHLILCRFNN